MNLLRLKDFFNGLTYHLNMDLLDYISLDDFNPVRKKTSSKANCKIHLLSFVSGRLGFSPILFVALFCYTGHSPCLHLNTFVHIFPKGMGTWLTKFFLSQWWNMDLICHLSSSLKSDFQPCRTEIDLQFLQLKFIDYTFHRAWICFQEARLTGRKRW